MSSGDFLFSRSASSLVNSGGMCCTITTGTGKSPDNAGSNSPKALGPPVEVPIARRSTRDALSALVAAAVTLVAASPGRGSRLCRAHSALTLGISSWRMMPSVCSRLLVLLGFVT